MNQVTLRDCLAPTESESDLKKVGKIICGSCIMIALSIPVVAVILVMLVKIFGYT